MAYIINRFDGTQLSIVDDGVLDNSTSLGLIGRNYTGYGETQNENFVFLLENFANNAPPTRALRGQIWYNTTEKALKVYGIGPLVGGASTFQWLSIGNATVAETDPAHSNGGLWLKSTTNQLYVSDGTVWRQVGPEGVDGFAVTKMTSTAIRDSFGSLKPVIIAQVNGETTTVYTNEAFVINIEDNIPGFNQLFKGINVKSDSVVNGNLRGNADTATQFQTSRTINNVAFNGTSNITVTSTTNQPLKAGDYIIGSEFNGAFDTTWDIDADPENRVGKIVARDSTGSFSATTVTAAEFVGELLGNVTTITGTSTFNNMVVNAITGTSFSGLAARATQLSARRTINTVAFDGTEDIILPVPAETLTGNTLAANIVASSLTSLGQLEFLNVEAPGITVGDGNNLNIKIEGFTPTIESDTTNIIKLKLATGGVTANSATTVTFLSASAAAADGVGLPALVPDYTLGTAIDNRPVLGLPSHRWRNIYSKAATLDTLNVTTLSGRTVDDQVVVSNNLAVTGAMYGAVFGTLTGSVTGAASLNLLKSGDTMSGDIGWITTGRGIEWRTNTDGASIRFYNTGDGDADSRLEFNTFDNGNEYFRWVHTNSSTIYESMRLVPNSSGNAVLTITGNIISTGSLTGTHVGDGNQITNLNATQILTGTVPAARLTGSYNINVVGNVTGNVAGNVTGNTQGVHTGSVVGNVTGAASLNLLKSGDAMTGDISWSTTGRGLSWGMNTDGASIRFYNTGDGDTASRLEFQTTDNGDEYFSWTHALSGGGTIESMRLVSTSSGNAALTVFGNATINGTTTGTFSGTGTALTLNADNLTTGTVPSGRLTGTYNIGITGNAATATLADTATNQSGGSINATTGNFSGLVNVSVAGIKFPNDPYGGSGDTASITYETISGEKTRLRFRVTNDAGITSVDDKAEFLVPDNDSVLINSHVVFNAANYTNYVATKSGTGATGTWPININGSAATANTVDSITEAQIVSALGYVPSDTGLAASGIVGVSATISGPITSTSTSTGALVVAGGAGFGLDVTVGGSVTADDGFIGNLLSTGAAGTAGTVTGNWTLSSGSRLQATYADLAELYTSDESYEAGTVLIFGGNAETTTTTIYGDTRLAGVVSTNPAHLLNSNLTGTVSAVALVGRIPCKIMGQIKKGDMLTTSSIPGYAIKMIEFIPGAFIGKALHDKETSGEGIVEISLNRA